MPKSKSDVEPGLKVARFRLVVMPRRLADGHDVLMNRLPATGAEALWFSPNRHSPPMVASKDSLTPGPAQGDRDGTQHGGHAFSHELGHVLGCPDEYTAHQRNMTPEVSTTASGFWPRVPRFSQQLGSRWDGGRPYHNDPHSVMESNRAPRLRHYWHFVQLLNSIGGKGSVLLSEDYRLENRSWPDKLRYEPPAVSGAGIKSDAHVWEPIARNTVGHSDALLYRLGDDEFSAWGVFSEKSELPPNQRYDGLLFVRMYIWFHLPAAVSAGAGSLDPEYGVLRTFFERFYKTNFVTPEHKFFIEPRPNTAGVTPHLPLKKIAIVFYPQLKFGPKPEGGQGADAGGPHVDGIHAGVNVNIVPSTPHPLVDATPPTFLTMESGQVNLSLARFAMGLKHRFQALAPSAPGGFIWQPIDVAFQRDELQPLADAVSRMMNDPGFSSGNPTRQAIEVPP